VDGQEILRRFHERYGPTAGKDGPVLFVREVLGAEPDEWQVEVLEAFGARERLISIRSCHGPGKTALLAWCVLYMLLFRFPQKTVATAPTRGQLFDALYSEVGKWFTKLDPSLQALYHVKSDRIELLAAPDESFFSCRTARRESPEALQGIHSDNVLLIGDEASGIFEQIFEAAIGSMSGEYATTILASNPVRTSGFFFDTHHKLADMWHTVAISGFDSDRVSDAFIHDVARRYGEDSNAYRVRVLGEFPKADDDTIIPFELVESARDRDIKANPDSTRVWGLDVARFGDDKSVLCERQLHTENWCKEWKALDTMQLVGRVVHLWESTMPSDRPSEIMVDVIGLGAGVLDRLRELGLPARGVNVSESASSKDKYANLRSELWFLAREWLSGRDCHLTTDELARELVMPRYDVMSSGKVMAESKKDMKKRGHKSPNYADAFIMTFAGSAATMVHGRKQNTSWGEPLRRKLKGVV
jgi:hypothetical protein